MCVEKYAHAKKLYNDHSVGTLSNTTEYPFSVSANDARAKPFRSSFQKRLKKEVIQRATNISPSNGKTAWLSVLSTIRP